MEEQQYAATNIVCLHQPSTQSYTETIKKNYIYFKKIQNPINWKKYGADVWYSMQWIW